MSPTKDNSVDNLTIRDIANRGFIPYNPIYNEETTLLACQFCKNPSSANKAYLVKCFFDEGKHKEDLRICISCLHDYHKRVEELTGDSSYSKPKLVVADKVDNAKYEIFNACQDIIIKKKSFNQMKTTNADDNDRLNFVEVVRSLYDTSSLVRYYIGDNPENISLDNRKLWPLRYWVYSELKM